MTKSAKKRPVREVKRTIKSRRLRNPDAEVIFFFIGSPVADCYAVCRNF